MNQHTVVSDLSPLTLDKVKMMPDAIQFEITEKATIADVESSFERLEVFSSCNLRLPDNNIKAAGFGGESALIQFLVTWSRRNPNGVVQVPLQIGNAESEGYSLKHLSRRAYSFVAMLTAADVVAADGANSIRDRTNHACSIRVDEMSRGLEKAKFGHRTFLACVDHSTKAFIPAFYFADGTLRNRSEFVALAEELLLSRAAAFTNANISSATRRGLGLILYELVKNTHDWGRTNIDNAPLRPSIRGMLFTRLNVNRVGATASAKGNPSLEKYVSSLCERSQDNYVRFLELSIFDSGPGLASRWLNKPVTEQLSIQDEMDACFSCLRKHRSTSGASNRGLGLYDVLKTLQQLNAYLRVRTGRLALCRDFISQPLNGAESEEGPSLFDWNAGSNTPTIMPASEGTLFTIVIPLLEENE